MLIGAVPANIIPRCLWGIIPKTPGFEIVQRKPQFGDLKNSAIVVPSIKGPIKGSCRVINEKSRKFQLELPANISGEFILKSLPGDVVTVNGKKVYSPLQLKMLEPGKTIVEINSKSF